MKIPEIDYYKMYEDEIERKERRERRNEYEDMRADFNYDIEREERRGFDD